MMGGKRTRFEPKTSTRRESRGWDLKKPHAMKQCSWVTREGREIVDKLKRVRAIQLGREE